MSVVAPMVTSAPLTFETIYFIIFLILKYIYIRSIYRYTRNVQCTAASSFLFEGNDDFFWNLSFLVVSPLGLRKYRRRDGCHTTIHLPGNTKKSDSNRWFDGLGLDVKNSKLLHEDLRHSMALQQNVYSCFRVLLWYAVLPKHSWGWQPKWGISLKS